MDISSRTFSEGEMIPERCAYGRMGEGGQTVRSANLSRNFRGRAPRQAQNHLRCSASMTMCRRI